MSTDNQYSDVVKTAREYYNSSDADNFYTRIWGGEDLHLGIYNSPDDDIYVASRRTIDRMASYAKKIDASTRIIDLGGGFAGSARHLAKKYGCHVIVLNLSEAENERGRKMNTEQGLADLIDVIDGSFESIPFEEDTFDIIWSEDAILHSGDRRKVLEEAVRVLKPGGEIIFTDPMQTDTCDESVLQPVYDRINLSSLGSPAFYKENLKALGLREIAFEEMPEQLVNHYSKVLDETEKNMHKIEGYVSDRYVENMKKGLKHWIKGGKEGNLTWGIFVFRNE
ncbi:MAG: methyltransferase domain-containing protein [Bacteroidetes bacterium]|jgi:sarcosine/dimethylglycine N-methyltransferase|nr:methyltransferase domain-containing protein [Bacteroidota bacterium]